MTEDKKLQKSVKDKQAGFSLVEMAVVLMIGGLMLTPVYMAITKAAALGPSERRIELIRSGLAEHLRVYGYLPCPADRTDAPGDANYYRDSNYDEITNPNCTTSFPTLGTNGLEVYIGAVPVDPLIEAMGCTDDPPAEIADLVRTSIARIKDRIENPADPADNYKTDITNCLTREHLLNDEGHKFLYAVSERATRLFDPATPGTTFVIGDPTVGGIRIQDQNNNQATANDQIFVLVDHGPDGKGAYTSDGTLGAGCVAAGQDLENCDDDEFFKNMMVRLNQGPDYFDDQVDFSLAGVIREYGFWTKARGGANDNTILYESSRMVIGLPPDLSALPVSDRLVVSDGRMRVENGSVRVEKAGGPAGGNVWVDRDARAGNEVEVVNPTGYFESTQYCYDPGC